MCSCGENKGINLDQCAKNIRGFKLQVDTDGVKTDRDISWAESGRFSVFSASGVKLLEVTDPLQIVIDKPNTSVTVTLKTADMTGLNQNDWVGAQYRLDLFDSTGEATAVGYGPVNLRPYVKQ